MLIVEALSGTSIHTLALDNNVQTGLFSASKAKEAGDAIAKFLNSTTIRELSISGDDNHYLKAAVNIFLILIFDIFTAAFK